LKILHAVEFYAPSVGGMQEVVRQLSERMAAHGHDVTVVTTKVPERSFSVLNGVKVVGFNIKGNLANGLNGEVDRYRAYLLENQFDIISFFAAQQWTFDAAIPLLPELKAKKVFVPTGFSGLFNPVYQNYFKSMPEWMKEMDVSVFLSDDYRDIDFARKHHTGKWVVIPNGADEREFDSTAIRNVRDKFKIGNDEFLILHVGSYTGMKGHKEAMEIFYHSKARNTVLFLAGSHLSKLRKNLFKILNPKTFLNYLFNKKKRVIIADLDRADTVSLFMDADLFLFPSNVECSPLVIFESCAAKTPFLATDCGNVKEIIEWTHAGMVLPTNFDAKGYSFADILLSAEMLDKLIKDGEKLVQMSEKGYKAWKSRFTWEKITEEYEKLFREL